MINELQLLAGTDIPFPEAQISIHQPTLKEISYIGEDKFFYGCQLLKFSKDILNTEDKNRLSDYADFDILMQIIMGRKSGEKIIKDSIDNMFYILQLLFPNYEISLADKEIVIAREEEKHILNRDNFDAFKKILNEIFLLKYDKNSGDYNPQGSLSKRIAEKFKKRHQQLAKLQGDGKKIALYSRYVSILAVGEKKDINELMQYTIYQISDEYKRFCLKEEYDFYVKAKLQGAEKIKEPEDWMQDMYDDKSKKSSASSQKLVF